MAYYGKKYLSLLLAIALLNSSIQPLYASLPESEDEIVRKAGVQARIDMLEEALQNQIKNSATVIGNWTPFFIKNAVAKLGNWFESTLKNMPASYFAKSPLETDYTHNRAFWLAHFSSSMDDIKEGGYSNNALHARLVKLQDMVFTGVLSPYVYEKGLQEIEELGLGNQTLFESTREDFKKALKTAPGFIDQTFRHEVSLYIQDLQTGRGDAQEFISLIRYYRDIDNALDYKETLTTIRSYLREHKGALKITKKDYEAIIATLNSEIGRIAKDAKKRLKADQDFSMAASSMLPYFGQEWDEINQSTNNSLRLPSKVNNTTEEYLAAATKALHKLLYTGAKYAQDHPTQALMMVLAGQVTAVAALKAFSVPETPKDASARSREPSIKKDNVEESTTQPFISTLSRATKRNVGNEFQVSMQAGSETPWAARINNSSFIITYSVLNGDGNGYGSFGRLMDNAGNFLGSEFRLNNYTVSDQSSPTVADLGNNRFIATWVSNDQDGSGFGIYGQLFDDIGTHIGNEFRLNNHTSGDQWKSVPQGLAGGRFVVTWSSLNQDGSGQGVYARLFNNDATPLTDEFQVNDYTLSDQMESYITKLVNDDFVIVWKSQGQDGSGWGSYGQLFDRNTALKKGGEFPINNYTTNDQEVRSVTSLNNGGFAISWFSLGQDQNKSVSFYSSYMRLFDASANPTSGEIELTSTPQTQSYPVLTTLPNGNLASVWQSDEDGSGWGIFGRIFDGLGNSLGSQFLVPTNTTNAQQYPRAAALPDGNFVATWDSDQTGILGVFGKVINPNQYISTSTSSTITAGTTGPIVTTGTTSIVSTTGAMTTGGVIGNEFIINQNTNSTLAPFALSENNNAFIAWSGKLNGSPGIFGRIYDADGNALSTEFGISQSASPFPFGPSLASSIGSTIFVAWNGNPDVAPGIYGRMFFSNGTAISNEFGVSQNMIATQYRPFIVNIENNMTSNFFVTWYGLQTGDMDIYGRLFNANAAPLSGELKLNQNTTAIQSYPAIASSSDGIVFVAWQGNQTNDFDIYGRLFYSNGTALNDEFKLNQNTTADQYAPFILSLSNDNFFVAWDGTQIGDYDVYGRIFYANGTTLSNEFRLNQVTTSDQSDPFMTLLDNGKVLATWTGYQTGNGNIYGRVLDINGTALSNEFEINQNTIESRKIPSVANLGNGNVFATWQGSQNGGNIYGRILTPSILATLEATTTTSSSTAASGISSASSATGTITSSTTGSTGIVTTGPLMATTGHPTSEIPVTTHSVSSSSHSDGTLNTIIGASVGGGVVLIGGTALGALLYKKHKRAKQSSDVVSSSNPHSSAHASANMMELNDRSSIEPENSFNPSQQASAFSPTATGIEAARVRIKGQLHHNNYELLTDINRTLAKTIEEQTGVEIAFAPTEKKKKDFALGRGRFGKFMIARNIDREPKRIVGVKQVKGDREIQDSLKEGEIQSKFKHSNVMPLLDYINYQSDNSYEEEALEPALYQFMPLAGFGDGVLFQKKLALMKNPLLANKQEQVFSHVAEGLLKGLSFMHSLNYYHLDFKNTNFVITKDGTPQIIDFGCTQQCPDADKYTRGIGDARYYSLGRINFARFLQDIDHDEKASSYSPAATDAWALGITLLEMWYNNFPFETLSASLIFASWDKKYFEGKLALVEGIQAPKEGSMMHLIKRMVVLDDKDRIRVGEALKHPVFKSKANTLDLEEDRIKLFKELKALSETGSGADPNNNYTVTAVSDSLEIRDKYYQKNKNYN